ncbi:MAG TPA: DUF1016 N-terminal domain-containing protein [Solirubrobacteraceae bacterium]|nr:DUF1016 N-terminal domain-containing protein [Solirubrobacteraceae bacterium]
MQALLERLRDRIRESQVSAARALNTELVMLYWSIGRDILVEQRAGGWGEGVVARIADDLRQATGGARGFSRRNLFYMRRFATVWPEAEKVQPLAAQIGWTHHQVLLDAFADRPELYAWYAAKSAEHRWSRRHLSGQIDLKLHERQGAALTNFALTLPPADAQRPRERWHHPLHRTKRDRRKARAPPCVRADRGFHMEERNASADMDVGLSSAQHRMPAAGRASWSVKGAAGLAGARRAVRLICAGWVPQDRVSS